MSFVVCRCLSLFNGEFCRTLSYFFMNSVCKGEFTQHPFFARFFTFLLLREKVCAFFIPIFIFPYSHKLDCYILDKSFPKKNFCKGVQLYFEISLLSFINKIFQQNFYLHVAVHLVQIWTYKNADEKNA